MSLQSWFEDDDTTVPEWLDWYCCMHIWSCYLYEELSDPVLDDQGYDHMCQMIKNHYDDTAGWYKEQVSKNDLISGSGAVIAASMTDDQIAEARWWRYEYIPELRAKYPGGTSCNGSTKAKK